jgi:hypothetical protein
MDRVANLMIIIILCVGCLYATYVVPQISYTDHFCKDIFIKNIQIEDTGFSGSTNYVLDSNLTSYVIRQSEMIKIEKGYTYNVCISSSPLLKSQRIDQVNYEV